MKKKKPQPPKEKIPNKVTQRAMKNVMEGKNLTRYKSMEELMKEFE